MKNKGAQTGKIHDTLNSKFSNEGNYNFIKKIEVYHNNDGIFALFPFYNNKQDKKILESSFYNDFKANYEFSVMSSNVTKGLSTNHIAIEFKHGEVITGIKGYYDEENKRILSLKIQTNLSSFTLGKSSTLNNKTLFNFHKENNFIPGFKTSYMTDKSNCYLSYIGVYFESNENYQKNYFVEQKENKLLKFTNTMIKKADKLIYSLSRIVFIIFLALFPLLYYYARSNNIYGGDIDVISPRDKDFLLNNTQIHTDENGLAHIKANNLMDAMFSLGFVHARDRLFQIDFLRRLGNGKLSEIMGEKTLKIDKMIRKMGLSKINEQKNQYFQSTSGFKFISKYIQGVNYYANNFNLPIEYIILRSGFSEFTSLDVVAITNFMSFTLTTDWYAEIIHKYIEEGLGREFADIVMSIKHYEVPFGNETIVNEEELIELGLSIKDKAGAKIIDNVDESKIFELKKKRGEEEKKGKRQDKQQENTEDKSNKNNKNNNILNQDSKESNSSLADEANTNFTQGMNTLMEIQSNNTTTTTTTLDENTKINQINNIENTEDTILEQSASIENNENNSNKENINNESSAVENTEENKFQGTLEVTELENTPRTETEGEFEGIALDGIPTNQGASNSWVISGKHTQSGYPILSNDPHLSNSIPALTYLTKIYLPDNTITGTNIPGVPVFLSGSTKWMAWGITSENNDISDLCEEIIQEEFYIYNDKKIPLVKTEESIYIKGKNEEEIVEVVWTKNGPLLDEIIKEINPIKLKYKSPKPFSFRISWYLTSEFSLDIVFSLMRGKHIDEIQRTINRNISPTLSVVWANIKGDIGYFRTGKMIIKEQFATNLHKKSFCKGWKSQDDYKEFLDEKYYPNLTNPKKGFMVTANNRMASENFIYDFNGDHFYGRAFRIRQLIEGKITKKDKNGEDQKVSIEDNISFLADVKDVYAEYIMPKLIEIYERNKKKEYEEFRKHVSQMQEYQQIAQSNPDFQIPESKYSPPDSIVFLEHLRKWNYTMEADSHVASIYTILEYNLGYQLLLGLGPKIANSAITHRGFWNFLYSLIDKVHLGKTIDLKACSYLSGSKNCEKFIVRVLDNIGSYIKEEANFRGNVPVYGELVTQYYPSVLFDKIPITKYLFSKRIQTRGNRNTVKVSVNRFNSDLGKFTSVHSPVSQFLIDMKSPTEPFVNIQTGNSGSIFSKFYDNRILAIEKAELVQYKNYNFPLGAELNTILLVKK